MEILEQLLYIRSHSSMQKAYVMNTLVMNCDLTVRSIEPLSDLTATGSKGLPPTTSRSDVLDDSVLVNQGLDPAVTGAQLVDPHLSTTLPFDEDQNADIGLSAKTLRRLKDLGITELFAGA